MLHPLRKLGRVGKKSYFSRQCCVSIGSDRVATAVFRNDRLSWSFREGSCRLLQTLEGPVSQETKKLNPGCISEVSDCVASCKDLWCLLLRMMNHFAFLEW